MFKVSNPMRRYVCPICGEEFYPGESAIVSTVHPGTVLQPATTGMLSRIRVKSLDGNRLTRELAARQCPHCKQLLPRNLETVENHTIAIIGDVNSGKSHYIASCINQLKQDYALRVIGCNAIIGQGDTDQRYYNDYYLPVYMDRQKLENTRRAVATRLYRPLIYELVFPDKTGVNLLFYDSSGEDIVNQDALVQFSHFVLNASAVIFLADPMQMPAIVATLPAHLTKGLEQRPFKTSDVFNRVMATFRQSRNMSARSRLRIPVAITVSKSDLLKFSATKRRLPLFLYENYYTNKLDVSKLAQIDGEVRGLLQALGDRVLLTSSQLFEDVAFFAISATGWAPDDKNQFPPLEPTRCLDPLLWVLWRLGVVTL